MNDLNRLYRDTIKQHAGEPVGYRRKIDATHQFEEYNPLCGDRILIRLQIAGDHINSTAFDGEACAICMASASLLCENVSGQPVSLLQSLHDRLHEALSGDGDSGDIEILQPLLGVKPFPSRVRCATLPWTAASKAVSVAKPLKT